MTCNRRVARLNLPSSAQPRFRSVSATVAAVAASLVAMAHPLPARAAEIVLDAGGGCVERDDVTFQVERALGQPLSAVSDARFLVHERPAKVGVRAELEIRDAGGAVPRGSRSLAAETCEALTQQIALAIALALGEHGIDAETESSPPVRVPADPVPEDAPRPAADRAAPEPAAASVEPEARGGGPALAGSVWILGDTGTLPALGWGIGAGFELDWSRFELRALGTRLPEREGHVDPSNPGSPGAEIGLWAGSVLACLPVARERAALDLSVCAGGELGALSGSGTRVSTPYHQRSLWAAARFDLVGRWAIAHSPLSIEALITAAAPLARDEFVLKDIGSIHRPESVLGRAALGVRFFID